MKNISAFFSLAFAVTHHVLSHYLSTLTFSPHTKKRKIENSQLPNILTCNSMSRRKEIASMGTRNENSPGLEEREEEVECLEDNPSTKQITNGSGRIVRGPTRGLSLQKKRRSKQKLDIVIHPMRKRIVGPHAMDFKTEACVIVKQNTPLEYARWKDIPKEIKLKLWMGMKQKFNLEEDYQVKDVVYAQLNRQYRNYRHKLHAHYLKSKGEGEILDQSPDGVPRDDWKQLIDYFESDHFKKMSDRNKKNRQNLTMSHSCGTKSIAQKCYEERNIETGDEPTRTAAWRMSRYNNRKKEWTDEASRDVYEELLRLQSEPIEDGEYPMEEDEAFVKVLGEEKSSRLRGCGDGLKPPSKRGERVNNELQKENEGLRKQNEAMSSQLESLEAQVGSQESQMQAQVEALLKAQLPAILQGLSQSQLPN